MSLMVAVNPDSSISVRIEAGGVVHRYVLQPGHYDERGAWVDVDLSDEPQEAIDLATETWTPAVLSAWIEAHPWVPPAPPTGEIVDLEREDRIAMPLAVQVPSLGAAIRINMDEKSQRNVQGLATAGILLSSAAPGQKTAFRDYDNVSHDLLPGDLVQIGLQVMARIQAVYQRAWALKAMDPIPADYRDDKYW